MYADEPVAVVFTVAVAAALSIVQFKVSPFVKATEALSVPEVSYLTNKVSGSVPSVAATPIQFATTPEVTPVNLTPLYFVISETDLADSFTA